MECSNPPPLSDDQLSALIDGENDPALQAHLDSCPACAARLADARTLERRLSGAMWRWDCPPPDLLGDYDLGLLAGNAEAQAIAAHLQRCPRCTEELAELRVFLGDTAPPTPVPPREPRPLGRRIYELIAQLLPPDPAVALRGDAGWPRLAVAEGVTLILDLEPGAGSSLVLVGQLGVDPGQEPWEEALVQVRQAGEVVAAVAVGADGGFRCPVSPDITAAVRIVAPDGRSILVPDLSLA